MTDAKRPRLTEREWESLVQKVIAAETGQEVRRLVEELWDRLRGDMQDRITTLIHAAQAMLEAEGTTPENEAAKRKGLERSLRALDGKEMAATTFPRKDAADD